MSPERKNPRSFSIFDYTITLTRRGRYLVLSCPELGLTCAAQPLDAPLSPDAMGKAVLQAFEQVNRRIFQLESAGLSPPRPADVQRLLAPTRRFSTGKAAQVLGVSRSTLLRMARKGDVKCERTRGGHLRFTLESVHQSA